jgi:hypothetical protein
MRWFFQIFSFCKSSKEGQQEATWTARTTQQTEDLQPVACYNTWGTTVVLRDAQSHVLTCPGAAGDGSSHMLLGLLLMKNNTAAAAA